MFVLHQIRIHKVAEFLVQREKVDTVSTLGVAVTATASGAAAAVVVVVVVVVVDVIVDYAGRCDGGGT